MKTALLILFVTFEIQAALKLPTPAEYLSGKQLCTEKYASLVAHEKGFFTKVPVDYANPQKGETEVYAYFSGDYDPSKETLLYFIGGPGQTVHWGLFKTDVPFNVLMLEQRGIGCSRPAALEQYLSPQFYSSDFTVRDAETVRKNLNIPQLTVYGISYGTIPATMYASLFPQSTRAVILEGVANSGDGSLWEATHRRKLLQKMLNSLPADILQKLDEIHTVHGVPATWFSFLARDRMMANDGLNDFKKRLLEIKDPQKYQSLIEKAKEPFAPITYEPHPLFIANEIPYYMLACQELGIGLKTVSVHHALKSGVLASQVDQETINNCEVVKARHNKPYDSTKFPFKTPVTYFQGSQDGATAAPGAIQHYKTVPQGPKQLMILVRGGHNPNLYNLSMEESGQLDLFNFAFKGLRIPSELLQKVQKEQPLRWVFTSKGF